MNVMKRNLPKLFMLQQVKNSYFKNTSGMNFYALCLFFGFFYLMSGCDEPQAPKPYKVKIPIAKGSGYSYETVTLDSLTNIEKIEGDYVAIKGGAEVTVTEDVEEIVKSENPSNIYSKDPSHIKINFIEKDGVIIPKDFTSMAAFTLYYNYEQTFNFWRDNLGLTLESFGKLTLINNPLLILDLDGGSASVSVKVNAAFVPGPRDLWFFKETDRSEIPLKMNLGVMAHEFSHAIFDDQFADRNPQVYESVSEEASFWISAINEGVADYFAFMVTGRTNDFALSLKELSSERQLPIYWTLSTVDLISCASSFYCYGSILATALYQISLDLAGTYDNSPVEVGRRVYQALSDDNFSAYWFTQKVQTKPSPLYAKFLEAIYSAAPELDRGVYCARFVEYFNTIDEITALGEFGCSAE